MEMPAMFDVGHFQKYQRPLLFPQGLPCLLFFLIVFNSFPTIFCLSYFSFSTFPFSLLHSCFLSPMADCPQLTIFVNENSLYFFCTSMFLYSSYNPYYCTTYRFFS